MINLISVVLLVDNRQFVSLFSVRLRVFFTVNNRFTPHGSTQLYGNINVFSRMGNRCVETWFVIAFLKLLCLPFM